MCVNGNFIPGTILSLAQLSAIFLFALLRLWFLELGFTWSCGYRVLDHFWELRNPVFHDRNVYLFQACPDDVLSFCNDSIAGSATRALRGLGLHSKALTRAIGDVEAVVMQS
jgi:hypothetical protein